MAKCACCGKGVAFGIKVSHSHRRSNRTWSPNVKRVKAVVDGKIAGHVVTGFLHFPFSFFERSPHDPQRPDYPAELCQHQTA